jgi:hypothetical protein
MEASVMDSDVLVMACCSKSMPTTINVSGFAPFTFTTLYFVAMPSPENQFECWSTLESIIFWQGIPWAEGTGAKTTEGNGRKSKSAQAHESN